ncbi:isoprenyl transferase [Bacillaceae bacterium Marseille-Q3522]|nr:isoprenyl transferase [Bacillaceae bacterium Marseille-Q3522]
MLEKMKIWKKDHASFNLGERLKRIKRQSIPSHVAIIMDGNGRWAKKRALPRFAGHHEGMKTVRKITKIANNIGIKTLTVYAFSTENWKRPKSEVDYLMQLPKEFLGTFLPELVAENVKVHMIGYKNKLPAHTLKAVEQAIHDTRNNTGLTLNFALNYGGKAEIIEAVKAVVSDCENGNVTKEQLTEEIFSNYLMTTGLSDPDLLIRTSGEFRLSNFMLWQLAYTEFWFTDVLWPDFTEKDLIEAIEGYQSRQRRFGGV